MRALVQRVSNAHVEVDGEVVGAIGRGLAVLIGVTLDDGKADAETIGRKLAGLRVFADDDGLMNRSVADVDGSVLIVSQFTLYGDVRKGRRPSFVEAAPPEHAEPLVSAVIDTVAAEGIPVATGRFRTTMAVHLVNDGPVTLLIESRGGSILA